MMPLVLWLIALLTAPAAAPTLGDLLGRFPADSLPAPLQRFEAARHGEPAAESAFTLGQLHYARGEYRGAAEAFTRAAARFEPERKDEARYWAGLSWLGAGVPGQARSLLEEVARGGSDRAAEAKLGTALCWEASHRSDRALEVLQGLIAGDPGEAAPAALEELASLAIRLGRPEVARRAQQRLIEQYPRSVEAMRAELAPAAASVPRAPKPPRSGAAVSRPAPPPAAVQGPFSVQIGAFREPNRANVLAASARRAGFGPVRVSAIEDAGGRLFAVRVGVYATAEDARAACARVGPALGVACRIVSAP
jgi:tetratricopeptide (TPR) repeat protein